MRCVRFWSNAATRKTGGFLGPPQSVFGAHRSEGAVVLGVCSRLATVFGAGVATVRVSFVLLGLALGWGAVLYLAALVWLEAPRPEQARSSSLRGNAGVVFATASQILFVHRLTRGLPLIAFFAAALALYGFSLGVDALGASATTSLLSMRRRLVMGATLVGLAIVTVLARAASWADLWWSFAGALALAAGVSLFVWPLVERVIREFEVERSNRIRSEERAGLAAHLHDSVLQTLTIIQNRVDEPQVVATLAHRQERELREWLYSGTVDSHRGPHQSLHFRLKEMVAELEDRYAVRVNAVLVRDFEMSANLEALVQALREAITNAAKFSQQAEIALYVEVADNKATGYVRDRGVGFDPLTVPSDRRGIADSIHARMARVGGICVVRSRPGEGTEISLEVDVP